MMLDETIDKIILLYEDPVISALVSALAVFIVSSLSMYLFTKRKTIFQTYLYIN